MIYDIWYIIDYTAVIIPVKAVVTASRAGAIPKKNDDRWLMVMIIIIMLMMMIIDDDSDDKNDRSEQLRRLTYTFDDQFRNFFILPWRNSINDIIICVIDYTA